MIEWHKGHLGDCVKLLSGGTPSKSTPEYWGGNTPWVSAKDMKSFMIEDTEDRLTDKGANKATRIVDAETTLILVRGMTLHNDVPICRVKQPSAFNQDVKAVLPLPGICSDFVPYLLLGNKTRLLSKVDSAGHGTGRLNTDVLLSLPVIVPPEEKQRAIAEILGSLDDKIELNRRMNGALEAMARAIFKAWFIDFEPVKAKAAGATSFPDMPQEVFDQLPAEFTESELGPIPEGWKVKPLAETVKLTMGQSPKSEYYNQDGEGLPFHQGVSDHGFRFPSRRVYCTVEGRIAGQGDVLLSVRAPVGRINVADIRIVLGRGLAGMRHREDKQSFLLYQMKQIFAEDDAFGDGTVYKSVNKKFLESMPLLAPSNEVVAFFEKIGASLDQLILSNELESRILAALRDALLPQLISGEVRVGVAEKSVGRAL